MEAATSSELEQLFGELSAENRRRLQRAGLHTLADVRNALRRRAGRAAAALRTLPRVRAVARLLACVDQAPLAVALVDAGWQTVAAFAAASEAELDGLAEKRSLQRAALFGGQRRARSLQRRSAIVQTAAVAQRQTFKGSSSTGADPYDLLDDLPDLVPAAAPDACQPCQECRSALGKAGYLLDLLNFAAYRFGLTVPDVEAELHRGFEQLPAGCDGELLPVDPRLISCEVLERLLVESGGFADVRAVQARLDAIQDPDWLAYRSGLRDGVGPLLGVAIDQYREYLRLLVGGGGSLTGDEIRTVKAVEQALGLQPSQPTRRYIEILGEPLIREARLRERLSRLAHDPLLVLAPDDHALGPFTLRGLRRRQLAARWSAEDALLQLAAGSPRAAVVAEQRMQELATAEQELKRGIDGLQRGLINRYKAALLRFAAATTHKSVEELTDLLRLEGAGARCGDLSRLDEAILALQGLIEDRLLGGQGTRPGTDDADWETYRTYESWRGLQTGRLYPELFHDHESDLRRAVAAFWFEIVASGGEGAGPMVPVDDGIVPAIDGSSPSRPGLRSLLNQLDTRAYGDEGAQLEVDLTAIHRYVWSVLGADPPVARPPFRPPAAPSAVERAAEPATTTGLSRGQWRGLQQRPLTRSFGGSRVTLVADPIAAHRPRIRGDDLGLDLPNANPGPLELYHYLVAFYILPRMWAHFYYNRQDHFRAARFLHLIYDEELSDPIVCRVLRRAPASVDPNQPTALNPLNLFDVEVKDVKLLLARNYVDWADLELRRNTRESRAAAERLHLRALAVLGYAARESDDRPSCEQPCERLAGEVLVRALEGVGVAFDPQLDDLFGRARGGLGSVAAWQRLGKDVERAIGRGGSVAGRRRAVGAAIERALADRPADPPLAAISAAGRHYRDELAARVENRLLGHLGGSIALPPGPGHGPLPPGPDPGRGGPFPHPPDEPVPSGPDEPLVPGYFDDDPFPSPGDPFHDPVRLVPTYIEYRLCVPENPLAASLAGRACVGLRLLRDCRNVLGYRDDHVPIFRFNVLLAEARNLAELAARAESTFIEFVTRAEEAALSLLRETQTLQLATAGVALHDSMLSQTRVQASAAQAQVARVELQGQQIQDQLDAGATDYEDQALEHLQQSSNLSDQAAFVQGIGAAGAVLGGMLGGFLGTAGGPGGTVLGAIIGGGAIGLATGGLSSIAGSLSSQAASQSSQAQIAQLHNSIQQRLDELGRAKELNVDDAEIAADNAEAARLGIDIAQQQLQIARLTADYERDIVHFLQTRQMNEQRLRWLANVSRESYRQFLQYAIVCAWLAERALAFELGLDFTGQGFGLIRFDYWSERSDGLTGVELLRRDLETLGQRRLVDEQRKHQITRVVSLAQLSPIDLANLRRTGQLFLTTLESWFERDFPRHYLRLIKTVSLNMAALVPPTEGIRATLTHLGTSRATVRRTDGRFETAELRRPPESVALSSPLGATGRFLPLLPEGEQLNPFEGQAVAGAWLLELPKGSNPSLDFESIMDVQIVIQYTALEDPTKLPLYPLVAQGAISLSAQTAEPDATYQLFNPDFYAAAYGYRPGEAAPLYRLRFRIDERRFPPNQTRRRLSSVTLLLTRTDDADKRPVTSLRYCASADSAPVPVWTDEVTPPNGLIRRTPTNIASPVGLWELALEADEPAWRAAVGQATGLAEPLDLTAASVQISDLFTWEQRNGQLEPRQINGHNVLDLTWLQDALLMLEFDYVTAS